MFGGALCFGRRQSDGLGLPGNPEALAIIFCLALSVHRAENHISCSILEGLKLLVKSRKADFSSLR